jgi:hypothetical protein
MEMNFNIWRWTIKACLPNPPLHEYIADWVDYIINHCDAIPKMTFFGHQN